MTEKKIKELTDISQWTDAERDAFVKKLREHQKHNGPLREYVNTGQFCQLKPGQSGPTIEEVAESLEKERLQQHLKERVAQLEKDYEERSAEQERRIARAVARVEEDWLKTLDRIAMEPADVQADAKALGKLVESGGETIGTQVEHEMQEILSGAAARTQYDRRLNETLHPEARIQRLELQLQAARQKSARRKREIKRLSFLVELWRKRAICAYKQGKRGETLRVEDDSKTTQARTLAPGRKMCNY